MTGFSNSNVANSISLELANNLIAANYLVYWATTDAVQTPDGFYYQWHTNYAVHSANPTFAGRVAAAKAMITLLEHMPANPKWLKRPITAARPIGQDEVVIPALSVELGAAIPVHNYELGSRVKWRFRQLIVDGRVRSREEQTDLCDLLSEWFDNESFHEIFEHDASTLASVGDVECADSSVDYSINPLSLEPLTFQVICNARLQFIA